MRKALARAEAQYQSLVETQFESDVLFTVKQLDAYHNVVKLDWEKRRQYPFSGALFEETIEKNGAPLTRGEQRNQEKKKREFAREVENRISRGLHPQPEKEPGIRFNAEFVGRYRLSKAGMETVRQHQCWVISFEPKSESLPVRTRMDQALNHSIGKFWICQEDYGLVRIEFALRKPFKYWGGFLAVIRNTDGRMDYHRVEPNVWLPADFELKLDLELLMVKDIRRDITIRWSNYRRSGRIAGRGGSAISRRS